MSRIIRTFWLFTLVAFLGMTAACSRQVVRPVSEELARDGTAIRKEEGQDISGYQLVDQQVAKFDGNVRYVEPDSLAFTRYVKYGGTGMIEKPWGTYSLAAVKALVISESKPGATLALTAGLLVIGIIVYAAASGVSDYGGFSN